jgi:hypothetical protein
VTGFLTAWQSQNPAELEPFAAPKFYDSALKVADLSQVGLPSPVNVPEDFEIRSFSGQLTVILPQAADIVRISLEPPEPEKAAAGKSKKEADAVESRFVVSDITLYDRVSQRQTNLLSAFTAPARAQLFLMALQSGDLPMLRQLSSATLNAAAWNEVTPELFAALNLNDIPAGKVTLQDSRVRGDQTELEFLTGDGRLCSVSMLDENGVLKIDDLQYPDQTLAISSLKTRLTLAVPVTELATAWAGDDLKAVSGHCSGDFNRLVWSNVGTLPAGFDQLTAWLQMPVQQASADDLHGHIRMSAPGRPVVDVALLRENALWKIDEIRIRQPDGSVCELRKVLRQDIAQTILQQPAGGIQQLRFQPDSIPGDSGVKHASAEVTASRGNLTIPSTRPPERKSRPALSATDAAVRSRRDDGRFEPIRPAADGTLRFGPDADAPMPVAEEMASDDFTGLTDESGLPSRPASEPVEIDGVMYFPGAVPTAETPQDLSERPIPIPRE